MREAQKLILVFTMALGLHGCATLDREECLTADWTLIGVEDGSNGRPFSCIGEHREACAEYQVTPNLNTYTTGRNQGLKNFCTEASGYNSGRRGDYYNGVCMGESEIAFLSGYHDGKLLHRAQSTRDDVADQLNHRKRKLRTIINTLSQKKQRLDTEELTKEKRTELRADMKDLRRSKHRIKHKIHRLKLELAEHNAHYNWLLVTYGR